MGHVGNINASSNTFTLTNATASYSLKVDNTSTFFPFPTNVCATSGFRVPAEQSNPQRGYWHPVGRIDSGPQHRFLRMPTVATRKSRA